jgi:radial spoke head protein 4A
MKMFEWSGISFGDQECYTIYKAMKRLAKLSGATKLRFWGKFLGRQRDYFVLEGELPYSEEGKAGGNIEERGIGANSHIYWVTDDLLGDWIQLPDVEPKFIEAARNIKHIVTGNLNQEINTNPKFPGKERHFLRAQIARIAHSTTLIPKEYMIPNEDNEKEVVINEEFAGISENAIEMKSLEGWCYAYQEILPGGVTVLPNLEDPEGDVTFTERLKGVTEEKQVHKEIEGAWVSKVTGSDQQYAGADEGSVSYA